MFGCLCVWVGIVCLNNSLDSEFLIRNTVSSMSLFLSQFYLYLLAMIKKKKVEEANQWLFSYNAICLSASQPKGYPEQKPPLGMQLMD